MRIFWSKSSHALGILSKSMKKLFTERVQLTQVETFLWPFTSSLFLGWLISSEQNNYVRIGNSFSLLIALMAVFAYGSIEDAPLDALSEGRNPDNPISKGSIDILSAWKTCFSLAGIALALSIFTSGSTVMANFGILVVGGLYFYHSLRLRQSMVLDALGFSILTSLLPFLSATNLSTVQFGNNSWVSGSLAFVLAYASYFSLVETRAKNITGANLRYKLSGILIVASFLILFTSLYVFTFSGMVPAWVTILIVVLYVIMLYPQFSRRKTGLKGPLVHMIFINFQRALAIGLVTFFLATQIFRIIR